MWAYPPRAILVAVDFGDASSSALRVAGELGRQFDSAITAFHAETFEAPPYFTREQVKVIEQQRKGARREAVKFLERHATRLAGRPVKAVISEAPPATGILDAAREEDLIVMGTHGRRGPARWWAGSVAERVVREARIPVLVLRDAPEDLRAIFSRITVVARGGTYDGPARRYARGLAEAFGGEWSHQPGASPKSAGLAEASLVVLAQPGPDAAAIVTGTADQVVRSCERPLLLVPSI